MIERGFKMKVFKIIWFLVSVAMIGTGGYFLYANNQDSGIKAKTPEKVVKKEVAASLVYMNDNISLKNAVTTAR